MISCSRHRAPGDTTLPYNRGMDRLLELLRSLGNAGAVTNARALAVDRRREDWVIQALERRVSAPQLRRTA